MKCKDIIQMLEEKYPPSMAEAWDNVGLLVGDGEKEVSRVFLALDATEQVLAEAVNWGADMLITHHPLIFGSLKHVNTGNFLGRRIIQLIKNDISYYAMHTNYDICGMADLSAGYLKLTDTSVLEVTYRDGERLEGIGRIGTLPGSMTLEECAGHVKECLGLSHVTVYGDLEQQITRAAISTGSGKSMVDAALAGKAQVLITGDIDYHTGIDGPAKGIGIIDAGHYGTEYIFIDDMRKVLDKEFPQLTVKGRKIEEPYTWI